MGHRTVYCHFSFKRPTKRKGMAYFAVAFYEDSAGKKLIAQRTVEQYLWEDNQFTTAVQSYEYALNFIHEWQGIMVDKGIFQVMLVTDNSTLAGWIENPKKNKVYEKHMMRAIKDYKIGAPKEIVVSIGLCEVVKYEKSHKYCDIKYVDPKYSLAERDKSIFKQIEYKTIYDMLDECEKEPKINIINN